MRSSAAMLYRKIILHCGSIAKTEGVVLTGTYLQLQKSGYLCFFFGCKISDIFCFCLFQIDMHAEWLIINEMPKAGHARSDGLILVANFRIKFDRVAALRVEI